jgi:peptidoglycan/LPS O-acetylase OafA/YrhL
MDCWGSIFFVLSGFLITGILVDSLEEEGFFKKFYARRVLRIFPLYYCVLFVLFLLSPWLHLHWHGMGWLMLGYLQNLHPSRIANFSPGAGIALNHLWSLAVEEQFYLVWPAIVFFVRDRHKLLLITLWMSAAALILRLVLIAAGVWTYTIHLNTVTRADTLLLGGTLALLYRSPRWKRVVRVAPWGFLTALCAVLVSIKLIGFGSSYYDTPAPQFWWYGLWYTVVALGWACLIACSLRPASACEWIFEWQWLRFLGKYSYGIYVLHMILLGPLTKMAAQRDPAMDTQ